MAWTFPGRNDIWTQKSKNKIKKYLKYPKKS